MRPPPDRGHGCALNFSRHNGFRGAVSRDSFPDWEVFPTAIPALTGFGSAFSTCTARTQWLAGPPPLEGDPARGRIHPA